ncbi:hypothetical protein A4X03_0g9512 [Tilletia caries]|uniref:Outer membrane protein beta-barrel domain-containing protein n=1 Tax=Tilletia caries TaxID=13290 RepID=A0A8T8SB53_9BASI|nr:hypothetical protein A4X03_0g9512 [Tilletia caries]
MKFLTKACFGMLLAASALSTPALAQEEASGPFTLSGGIAGFRCRTKSPLYGKFELDLFAGYSAEIASGTTIDAGVTYYMYPGNRDFAGPSDYVEFIGKLSHTLGPVGATATVAYAPDQKSLGSEDNIYLNLGLESGIPNSPVTLLASLGYTDGSLGAVSADGKYLDWMLGASFAAGPATFKMQYIDTDVKKTGVKAVDTLYDPTVVFTLGFSF